MNAPVLDWTFRRALRPMGLVIGLAALPLATPVLAQAAIPKEQAERVAKEAKKEAKDIEKAAEKAAKAEEKSGGEADSSPDEPASARTSIEDARTAAPNATGAAPTAARPALDARSGGAIGGIPSLVKFGLLAIFVLLLGLIGWLLWSNMRLKRQLAGVRQSHSDPARAASRRNLVSEQEHARQRPPYHGEGQAAPAPDGGYTPRGDAPAYAAPEPRIMGDDNWEPDLPMAQDAPGAQRAAPPRDDAPIPRLSPQSGGGFSAPPPPAPDPAPAFAAPSGPSLRLPLAEVQDLVRRAPEMAASEFRAAANALGQWREVNVNGTGGTLHLGEEDGLPRPLIAILQDDGNAVVVPSAQYARDFAFQHYKIRNSESLRPFFDLELSSRTELAYAAPCIVAIEGQAVRILQRGVLSGFSD